MHTEEQRASSNILYLPHNGYGFMVIIASIHHTFK
jgi:hypothetical protein